MTRTQRFLRPIINFLVERWFPRHCFYGNNYLDDFAEFDEKNRKTGKTVAMYLQSIMRKAKATELEVEMRGITKGDEMIGDYRITMVQLDG